MPTDPIPTRPASRTVQRGPRRGLVLGIVLTVQLMVVLDATIVNIALPDIARALKFTPTSLSWVITAYTLAFGGFLLLGARAGDLLGRKRVFMAGIGLFTVSSLLGGLAPSGDLLLAARALQGVGGAFAAPSALAFLMIMFTEGRERLRALGYYTAVSIGGGAIGLILGGILTQIASWRWVLFVNVPVGLIVLLLARRSLTETPSRNGYFDVLGALTSTVGISSLVYGFVRAASNGWGDVLTLGALALGVVLLGLFVVLERRASEPITPLRLFSDRSRNASYVARLFLVAGMFGMFFFMTQFLQDVLGYGPLETGLGFLPFSVALFAMSQLSARRLIERFGPKSLMVVGFSLSTLAVLLMTQLSASSTYVSVLVPVLLFGIGNGLGFVPLTGASLAGVRQEDAGAASGLVNVMQQMGGALGLAVLVSVFGPAGRIVPGQSVASARTAFVVGADHAFIAATLFVGATVLVLAAAIRGRRAAARATAAAAGEPERVQALVPAAALPNALETLAVSGVGASRPTESYEVISMVVSEADREPQLTATG
ncbi:MAG: MFS transporter [Candidatus Dormiibacterota bacterium]